MPKGERFISQRGYNGVIHAEADGQLIVVFIVGRDRDFDVPSGGQQFPHVERGYS
jgi:hypothetical protein